MLTLQPNGAAGKDIVIKSALGTRNGGASTKLDISSSGIKGLIEFDLSSIPVTATCDAAELRMYSSAQGSANAWTVTAYSIAAANEAWVEGTGALSGNAASGEPCWNALAADGSGGVTTAWAGAAGLATSGTDYESSALGTLTGNRSDAVGTQYSTALTASRVQGWFGSSNTNYGMILVSTAGNQHFMALSDYATAGYRPMLIITYTIGSESPTATPTPGPTSTPTTGPSPTATATATTEAVAATWPMAGANNQRTSYTTSEVAGTSPLWYRPFESYISQKVQPIAADGKVFVATSNGLTALDASNGDILWNYPTNMPLGHSPTFYTSTFTPASMASATVAAAAASSS